MYSNVIVSIALAYISPHFVHWQDCRGKEQETRGELVVEAIRKIINPGSAWILKNIYIIFGLYFLYVMMMNETTGLTFIS